MKKAFTMLELTFVIVVIGILSAIAIPKFAATRDDAIVSRARTTIGALRSAISTERQKRILKGDFTAVDGAAAEALLEYGLGSGWGRSGNTFTFTDASGSTCAFTLGTDNRLVKGTCGISGMNDL